MLLQLSNHSYGFLLVIAFAAHLNCQLKTFRRLSVKALFSETLNRDEYFFETRFFFSNQNLQATEPWSRSFAQIP